MTTRGHGGWPGAFHVEPWHLRTARLDPSDLAATESLFALVERAHRPRGSLEEGEPQRRSGTYISGFYEERPLPHPEAGYGFPESGQTVVNVTDGKLIRLHVGDSPFDLRYGRVDSHERALDLRAGILERRTDWTAPNGSSVRVTSRRLVSFTQRVLAAISYEVEPLDDGFYMAIQSDLLANEGAVQRRTRPARPAPLIRPLQRRADRQPGPPAPCWFTAPRAAGCGSPPGWTTCSTSLTAP